MKILTNHRLKIQQTVNSGCGISIDGEITEKIRMWKQQFFISQNIDFYSQIFSVYSDRLELCRYVQAYCNVRQRLIKFQPMVEGGDKRQKIELSVLHLGYRSLRYLMTGNGCGLFFHFKKTPTKLKLLFHIKIMKNTIFTVFVQNIWLYIRANNLIYCAPKRLELCRATIYYQLNT